MGRHVQTSVVGCARQSGVAAWQSGGLAERRLGGVEWLGRAERRLGGVEWLGRAEWRLGGVAEAVELCGAAELLGVPLTTSLLFFKALLARQMKGKSLWMMQYLQGYVLLIYIL